MPNKNSENEEFAMKRISTPQGDVPTVDSVMAALNLIVNRINTLTKDINERLKYSGAGIEASEYIERNLSETTVKINDLKKQLETNTEQIDGINDNITQLDKVVNNLEKMMKAAVGPDFEPQSKSYEEILEIKKMTKSLKDTMNQLQKTLGDEIEVGRLYWEDKQDIKESLKDLVAYEPEKTRILNYFKILNLPKPVLEIDTKILLFGPRGVGKTSLIRAIAKDQRAHVIDLNLPLIISLNASKQVESIATLFQFLKLKEDIKPCMVLLDNFDIIHKMQNTPAYLPFIEILIAELSRVHLTRDKILIVLILNEMGEVNGRLLDQFTEKIELKVPDQIARALILRKFLNEANLEPGFELDELSTKLAEPSFTEGFSAMDLKESFNIAKLQAFAEGRTSINENDLTMAIQVSKRRKSFQEFTEKKGGAKTEFELREKVQYLEEEVKNLKLLLGNSTRMLKHALRLALSDNYNLVNRLYNHYELTKKPLTVEELVQVTGLKEENLIKMINKMPYRFLFPKMGDLYYIAFDKSAFEEILAEFTLTV